MIDYGREIESAYVPGFFIAGVDRPAGSVIEATSLLPGSALLSGIQISPRAAVYSGKPFTP
jgi:hypothetical protein